MTALPIAPITLQCRECRAQGEVVPLDGLTVRGVPLAGIPTIPNCSCFLRSTNGILPLAVASMLDVELPALVDSALATAACTTPSTKAHDGASSLSTSVEPRRRVTHSAHQLPSRELMVYLSECCDEALLGSVVITSEHKLSNVLQMLRDELDVSPTDIYRGADDERLRVPLHKRQYHRPALPFFPSARHHLLVEEADHE